MSHPYSDLSQFSIPGLDPAAAAAAAAPAAAAVAAGLAAMAAQKTNPNAAASASAMPAEPSPSAATAGAGASPYLSAVLAAGPHSQHATAGASASQFSLPCAQPRPSLSASQENLAADSAALSAQLAARPPLTDIAQPSLIGAGLVRLIELKSARHTHTH